LQPGTGSDRHSYEWEAARVVGFALKGKPACGVFVVRTPSGVRSPRSCGLKAGWPGCAGSASLPLRAAVRPCGRCATEGSVWEMQPPW